MKPEKVIEMLFFIAETCALIVLYPITLVSNIIVDLIWLLPPKARAFLGYWFIAAFFPIPYGWMFYIGVIGIKFGHIFAGVLAVFIDLAIASVAAKMVVDREKQ